jgi:hypothetical protein
MKFLHSLAESFGKCQPGWAAYSSLFDEPSADPYFCLLQNISSPGVGSWRLGMIPRQVAGFIIGSITSPSVVLPGNAVVGRPYFTLRRPQLSPCRQCRGRQDISKTHRCGYILRILWVRVGLFLYFSIGSPSRLSPTFRLRMIYS